MVEIVGQPFFANVRATVLLIGHLSDLSKNVIIHIDCTSLLSVGREKRRVAWGETPYEDQTKEKTKGVKKFSENRSKTQRGGPTRNALCGDVQKHRSSEDWRSSRNITEKEPRENNISKDGGRFISSLRPVLYVEFWSRRIQLKQ